VTRTVDLAPDVGGRSRNIALAGAVLIMLAGVFSVAQDWIQHTQEGIAGYKAWTVAGPRCQTLTAGASAGRAQQIVAFGAAKFGREHGATQCSDVATYGGWGFDLFPVCQFDHPGLIEVSTRSGLYRFWPGYVNPATISIEHGVPTCVIGVSQNFGHRLIFDGPAPRPASTLR
jgi:hypothetical protein